MATNSLPHTTEDEITLAQLERFADRLSSESGTMAHRMASNGITAADLGIDRRQYARLRLCLTPRAESLEADIATIARTAGITAEQVRKAAGL